MISLDDDIGKMLMWYQFQDTYVVSTPVIEWLECQSVGIDTKAINQFRLDLEHKIGKQRSKQNTRILELSDLGSLFPEHVKLLYYKVERKASKPVYLDNYCTNVRRHNHLLHTFHL